MGLGRLQIRQTVLRRRRPHLSSSLIGFVRVNEALAPPVERRVGAVFSRDSPSAGE